MKREWVVLTAAMVWPSLCAAVYFVALGGAPTGDSPNRAVQFTYFGGKVVQFVLPLTYLLLVDPAHFRKLRLNSKGLGLGVLFGLATAGLIFAVTQWQADGVLADAPPRIRAKVVEMGVATPAKFLGLAAFLCVMHSLLEEGYYRWFLFGRLRKLLSFWPAAVVSGLAFMGHHVFVLNEYLPGHFWTATAPFSIGIAVGGFVWAWLYERTESLLASWVSHLIVDVAIMTVGYRLIFG